MKVAILALLCSQILHAQWSERSLKNVSDFNKNVSCSKCDESFWQNTFMVSLIDDLRLRFHSYGKRDTLYFNAKILELDLGNDFVSPNGDKLPFKYYFFDQGIKSVPTVVYLPGIFQGLNDEMTYRIVELILKSGKKVLMIPNPLSPEYLENYPTSFPGSFVKEASIVHDVITEYSNKNPESPLEIVSLSYGTFLSMIFLAQDAVTDTLIKGQTTLLFPPFNINESIRSLDQIMMAAEKTYFKGPKELVGAGFRAYLKRTHEILYRTFLEDQKNGFKMKRFPLELRADDPLRFAAFNRYETLKMPQDQLMFWLNLAWLRGNRRVRILTSDDDYINFRNRFIGSDHILVRKTGGHAGLLLTEWFESFFLEALK